MREGHPIEYYQYKPILENPLTIDFSKVRYYDELHELLREKFGLPDYYGKNLDALWDCLRYMWNPEEQFTIKLQGVFSMREALREDIEGILKIFNDVHEECPNVIFVIKS